MKNLLPAVTLVLASLLTACSSSSSPHLTSIQVTPASPSIAAGLTQQFMATGMYSDNSTQNLTTTATWSSSNTAVATINSGGLATTIAAGGPITISAAQNGVTGSAMLQVTAPTLTSIAVTPASATIPVGTFQQFTATGTYTDGSTQNLTATATWSSLTSTVASIAAGGLATAAAIGSTTITATSGSVNGSTPLSVAANSLVSLQITDGDVTIADGTSHQFTAIGFYNDGSKNNVTNNVTWGSSQTSVATISGTGRAASVNTGTSSITASLGSISAPAVTLTVTPATLTAITVGPSTRTIAPLTQLNFTAIGTFSDASTQNITQDVTWASSQVYATISNAPGSYGAAIGVSQGTTNISAALMGVMGSVPLTVSNATLSSITLTPSTAGMATGSTLALNAVGNFSDGTHQTIDTVAAWTTSASNVATVNTFGEVTGVTNGPVTITATLGGVSQNASLNVESLMALAVSPTPSVSFATDTSSPLQATGTLADGTTQNLTGTVLWTSSNPAAVIMSVASGSKGSAVGGAPGVSTVAAAFSGLVTPIQATVTSATVSSIAVTPANPSIALGSTPEQFKAQGTFSDGTMQTLTGQVTWTSSDINVAIIDASGAANTTGTGTTTVGATLNGVMGTTGLTVTP
jgi:trimeric autotransporter adhesin